MIWSFAGTPPGLWNGREENSIGRQPQLSCLFEQIIVYKDIKKHILEYTVADTNIGLIGFSGIV